MYRVIIIEDDPMVAAINQQYVESDPVFQVIKVFKSGIDALEYLKKQDTDLIILDFYTPLMNGTEFIDHLHGIGKAPAIIMVTSANDMTTINQLLSRGIVDYLVKPFEYTRFKTALEKFLQMKKLMDTAKDSMKQQDIDRLLGTQEKDGFLPGLTKGLNEATLNMIREFMKSNQDFMYTSEQIAEQLHLSRITIRRYMNYMTDINEIISTIDYQTGGRPSIKYSCPRRE